MHDNWIKYSFFHNFSLSICNSSLSCFQSEMFNSVFFTFSFIAFRSHTYNINYICNYFILFNTALYMFLMIFDSQSFKHCVIPRSFTLPQHKMLWRFIIHDITFNMLYYIMIKTDQLVISE